MATDVNVLLQNLNCIRQDRGSDGSYPFIWPTTVSINMNNLNVSVSGSEFPSLARVILANGMKSGDSAPIPSDIAQLGGRFEQDLSQFRVIVIVALLEKRDLSDDEILGGYSVFADSLRTAIITNLLALASSDPDTHQKAVDAINSYVYQQVHDAVEARMSGPEKAEFCAGQFTPDTLIDTANFEINLAGQPPFQLTFGNTPDKQANFYTIDAVVNIKPVTCEAEQYAVNQDQVVVNQLEAQLAELKKELAQAPPPEKKAILEDIKEFSTTELKPAIDKLNHDKAILAACQAGSVVPGESRSPVAVG